MLGKLSFNYVILFAVLHTDGLVGNTTCVVPFSGIYLHASPKAWLVAICCTFHHGMQGVHLDIHRVLSTPLSLPHEDLGVLVSAKLKPQYIPMLDQYISEHMVSIMISKYIPMDIEIVIQVN